MAASIILLHFISDDKVYLKVTVDPLLPSSIDVAFFGPTTPVEQYREKYMLGINNWNPDEDIYRNLLKIFGIYIYICLLLSLV